MPKIYYSSYKYAITVWRISVQFLFIALLSIAASLSASAQRPGAAPEKEREIQPVRPEAAPEDERELRPVTPKRAEAPDDKIVPIAVAAFDAYIDEKLCAEPDPHKTINENDKECLEIIKVKACRSGCWRQGYNYRYDATRPGQLDIHMSLEYLRKLRDLLGVELQHGQTKVGRRTFDGTLNDVLYNQIQMILRYNQVSNELRKGRRVEFHSAYNQSRRPAAGAIAADSSGRFVVRAEPTVSDLATTWPTLKLEDVISGRTVDPKKFSGVVFTNAFRTAHAMTQADMIKWLVSVAELFAARGQGDEAAYYLQLLERFFESFAVPDQFGGIRNNRQGYKCFSGKYCYFYHSQEVHDYPFPSSIINKNIYAIRDLAVTAHVLKRWRQFGTCNCSTAACWRKYRAQATVGGAAFSCGTPGLNFPDGAVSDDLADEMLERARGGLFNLAYGWGNTDIGDGYDAPPPNLCEFMKKTNRGNDSRDYFRSSYGYWVNDFQDQVVPPEPKAKPGEFRRGAADITKVNNCHYHYLTLNIFADVLKLTEESIYLAPDADFRNVKNALLYGPQPGTINNETICRATGAGGSVGGVPLAEFYLSGRTLGFDYQIDEGKCKGSAQSFINDADSLRKWYDKKYFRRSFD